jgi:hypothetical protein
MKIRRQDNGGVMVFGLVQLGCAASNLHEAETAYDILGWLSAKYWNTNLFTFHDPGGLFNCDLSGGFQQFIIKMLAYSEPGEVYLLPALPLELSKGSICGLLLRGDMKLDRLSWNANEVDAVLNSDIAQTVKLKMQRSVKNYTVSGAKVKRVSDKVLEVEIPQKKDVKIHLDL